MLQNNKKIYTINKDGNKVEFDVIFTFKNEENGKDYIVYTDNSKDETGNIQVYASIYHPEEGNGRLEAIETDKEWKIIETILETLQEEIKNQTKESENNEQ